VREPDVGGFEEFALGRALALRRLAYALTSDWHTADDLVQATFERAFSRWERVRGADNPDAYLRTILIRLAASEYRRPWRHKERNAGGFVEGSGIDDETGDITSRVDLATVLRGLTAKQRAVLVLRFVEDRSVAETAAILEIAEGTVKRQTHHALRRLRGILGDGDHYPDSDVNVCEVPGA
jgi:RNA polymerase sigma-70 factor (sigma-E family)